MSPFSTMFLTRNDKRAEELLFHILGHLYVTFYVKKCTVKLRIIPFTDHPHSFIWNIKV